LDDLAQAWPKAAKPIIIGLSGVLPDPYLLDWKRPENAIIEVPASMMAEDMGPVLVQRFRDIGVPVCLIGKPASPLPADLIPAFRYSLIRVQEDTRLKNRELASTSKFKRSIQSISVGVEDMETLEAAFATGATAVEGWPWRGSKSATWKAAQSSEQVILRLIQMVNAGDSPAKIDQLLRQDVTIAYKLMRYINSPAFGLAAEISSFQQAVMLLGYQKLQRWLSLLLLTASKDVNKAPVMQTALRRAFFMERIGQDMDAETRDHLFITGAFSLLDAIFGTTFEELCDELTSLPQPVVDALIDRAEPLGSYLKLAEAVEQRDGAAINRLAQSLALSQRAVNRALLAAIGDSDSLELA
jgi:c-di-GMP phosphodiesterase